MAGTTNNQMSKVTTEGIGWTEGDQNDFADLHEAVKNGKTKINELPQIINIIIGDLSIVGPRPQMQVDFKKYSYKKSLQKIPTVENPCRETSQKVILQGLFVGIFSQIFCLAVRNPYKKSWRTNPCRKIPTDKNRRDFFEGFFFQRYFFKEYIL